MRIRAAILGVMVLLLLPQTARAQYVDEPNSLTLTLGYTYAPSGKIISNASLWDTDGLEVPNQRILVHILTPSISYSTPLEGLAVEVELPLEGIKLGEGSFFHDPANGEFDDNEMHYTITDFRGTLRYQLKQIQEKVLLSFSAGVLIPAADYPTQGLTAPGHGLKGLLLGTDIARTLDPILPNMFFQVGYLLAIRERVKEDEFTEDLDRNYSDVSAFLGYYLPANFTARVGVNTHFSHGGANFNTILSDPPSINQFHDQLLNEDFVLGGGDVGYTVTPELNLGLGARFFIWGHNTRNQNLFGLFASYKVL